MKEMTMRQRMLAVVQGKEHDRVPFAQYSGLGPTPAEAWNLIGEDNMGLIRWTYAHMVHHPNCSWDSKPVEIDGVRGEKRTLHTPAGDMSDLRLFHVQTGSVHGRERLIKEPADYHKFIAFLRDAIVTDEGESMAQVHRELGETGLAHVAVPRTPFQQMWIEWVSLDDLCMHMCDEPELVNECMELLGDILMQAVRVVAKAPVPYVVIADNIHAPIVSPEYFERYCTQFYRKIVDLLAEEELQLYVHMDGDLKPLWNAIGTSGIGGIDSLSPPPDNDTSVGAALSMWPNMRILANFPSSVHLRSYDEVYKQTMLMLEEGGHTGRLQIQISENPPGEAWRTSYPAIVAAINDFGKP